MTAGLFFELYSDYEWQPGDPPDADAEFEPEETLHAIEAAFGLLGIRTKRIGGAKDLLRRWESLDIDVAFNIAEGYRSRNREAYVPVLLELAGIPLIGSDALTLSVSLDKAMTKDLAIASGMASPPYVVIGPDDEADPLSIALEYPLFVKPRYEGSSKGISFSSRVNQPEELPAVVNSMRRDYCQDVLVEQFIHGGGEFTVCVVGNDPPEALPVLQRAVERQSEIGLHALEHRGAPEAEWDYELGAQLTPELEQALQDAALAVYRKLDCRDFARMDFRTDSQGKVWFLEANPLPTFAPDGTFAIIAELVGMTYVELLSDVIGRALRRLGLQQNAAVSHPAR